MADRRGDEMQQAAEGRKRESPDVREFLQNLETTGTIGLHYVIFLGLRVYDAVRLLEKVRAGLPYHAWERLLRNTEIDKDELLQWVQITSRTLSRRKEEGRLLPDESDRLLRASRIFASALALFEGDADAARRWLTSPQPGLGGAPPIVFGATEIGAREVEALLGRLEHGVPS
jgi:putative toxin-antitoxin system antitoxin component (TIGR02293 family)